jgi:tryptophan 2,3-dioxygenase
VDYTRYLELPALLALQHPQSQPEHPDELLFIVVHQASELWFKVLLHEMERLDAAMVADDAELAGAIVTRINVLMRIVSQQLAALDTLPPQRFMQFRGYLGSSSGSQSEQFRALEARSGVRDEHFLQVLREHGEIPAIVQTALGAPTMESLFLGMVARAGLTLEALYLEHEHSPLTRLAEGLLEYEQQFGQWRFLHVQLVERIIGPRTGGTGGTLGAKYLSRTITQRKFFPALWDVRATMYKGSGTS